MSILYNFLFGVFRERRECEGRYFLRFCDFVKIDAIYNYIRFRRYGIGWGVRVL